MSGTDISFYNHIQMVLVNGPFLNVNLCVIFFYFKTLKVKKIKSYIFNGKLYCGYVGSGRANLFL